MKDVENFVDDIDALLRAVGGKLETNTAGSSSTKEEAQEEPKNKGGTTEDTCNKTEGEVQIDDSVVGYTNVTHAQDIEDSYNMKQAKVQIDDNKGVGDTNVTNAQNIESLMNEVDEQVKPDDVVKTTEVLGCNGISISGEVAQDKFTREDILIKDTQSSKTLQETPIEVVPRVESEGPQCVIKVIGVGDGGAYAMDSMVDEASDMELWAINTDAEAIMHSMDRTNALFIGHSITQGTRTKGNPKIGRLAAEESKQDIEKIVDGVDVFFRYLRFGRWDWQWSCTCNLKHFKAKRCLDCSRCDETFSV